MMKLTVIISTIIIGGTYGMLRLFMKDKIENCTINITNMRLYSEEIMNDKQQTMLFKYETICLNINCSEINDDYSIPNI